MKTLRALIVYAALVSYLSACAYNSVKPLEPGVSPSKSQSVVIYGVRLEGTPPASMFSVVLSQYDLERQATMANCFSYNRTEARVPAGQTQTSFFAFLVPAGYYAHGPFSSGPQAQPPVAFEAPGGQTVYLGDFVYTHDHRLEIRRDLAAARRATAAGREVPLENAHLANALGATPAQPFVCTP